MAEALRSRDPPRCDDHKSPPQRYANRNVNHLHGAWQTGSHETSTDEDLERDQSQNNPRSQIRRRPSAFGRQRTADG